MHEEFLPQVANVRHNCTFGDHVPEATDPPTWRFLRVDLQAAIGAAIRLPQCLSIRKEAIGG